VSTRSVARSSAVRKVADLEPPPGRFDDEDDASQKGPAPAWTSRVTVVPAEWYSTPPARRVYLLRDSRRDGAGYLPLGRVGQIIAEGGAGKTMACCQLAVSVATGARWLGTYDVATTGRVLMLLGEEDVEEAHRRLYRARRSMCAVAPPDGSIVVHALSGVPVSMLDVESGADTVYMSELRTWIAAHGPWALIVVDPLSRFAGADAETDNAAATRFVVALESIAVATGATVLCAHHTAKVARHGGEVTATAGRGSSALVDGVRWQVSMGVERLKLEDPEHQSRLGEIVIFAHTKSNYSRRAEPVYLRRDEDNGGALLPLDAVDLEIIRRARANPLASAKREDEGARHSKGISEDAKAIVAYVTANAGCSVRAARANAVRDSAGRWLRAVAFLGPALLANGRPISELPPGKSARLSVDRGSLPAGGAP